MAIYQPAVSGVNIINGLAVVCLGNTTQSYNNADRNVEFADLDSLATIDNLESRYLYHGGAGGSGAWEH